jgi:YD repeat-containing protein
LAKNATYTWDLENRLSQVSFTGGGTVTYKYDPFGRRIYRSGPSDSGSFQAVCEKWNEMAPRLGR